MRTKGIRAALAAVCIVMLLFPGNANRNRGATRSGTRQYARWKTECDRSACGICCAAKVKLSPSKFGAVAKR
jgi:hypothetical protein